MSEDTKIVFQGKETTTTIRPSGEKSELVAKVFNSINDTGLPSNEDLDVFGEQIIKFFKESKKNAKDEKSKQMVNAAQRVVKGMQSAIQEKNYDGRLQQISKRIKTESTKINIPISGEDSEVFSSAFKEMGPLLLNLGKTIIRDKEFRVLVITILDVLGSAYSRVKSKSDVPNVLSVIKEDIGDTENTGVTNTKKALNQAFMDITKHTTVTNDEKDLIFEKAINAGNKLKSQEDYRYLLQNIFKVSDQLLEIWNRIKARPELQDKYEKSTIVADVRVLIERYCPKELIDNWIMSLKNIAAISGDKRYRKLRKQVELLFFDPEERYTSVDDIKDLLHKIKHNIDLLNKNYNGVVKNLLTETEQIFKAFANDPTVVTIRDDINHLIKELFLDENGKTSVKALTGSLLRMRDTFFPIIKERINYISLPIIEIESKKFFFRISNVKIRLLDLFPEQMKVESDFNFKIDFSNLKRRGDFNLSVHLDPFNADIEGLKFYIKKKTGLKYKDYGVIDIYLKESSIMINFHLKLLKNEVDYIEVSKVSTKLKGLKVRVRESRHDILDRMATSLFLPTIRSKLEHLINEKLLENMNRGICDRINSGLEDLHVQKKNEKLNKKSNQSVEAHESLTHSDTKIKEKRVKKVKAPKDEIIVDEEVKIKEKRRKSPRIEKEVEVIDRDMKRKSPRIEKEVVVDKDIKRSSKRGNIEVMEKDVKRKTPRKIERDVDIVVENNSDYERKSYDSHSLDVVKEKRVPIPKGEITREKYVEKPHKIEKRYSVEPDIKKEVKVEKKEEYKPKVETKKDDPKLKGKYEKVEKYEVKDPKKVKVETKEKLDKDVKEKGKYEVKYDKNAKKEEKYIEKKKVIK